MHTERAPRENMHTHKHSQTKQADMEQRDAQTAKQTKLPTAGFENHVDRTIENAGSEMRAGDAEGWKWG